MDVAVAVVQGYLRLNGFFTVTEFPVLERDNHGVRTVTDVDVIGVRFPGAGRWIPGKRTDELVLGPDPALKLSDDSLEVLICEVKEGAAATNRSLLTREVVEIVLRRLGCCGQGHAEAAERIVSQGAALTHIGVGRTPCRIRVAVFAGGGSDRRPYLFVPLSAVVRFMRQQFVAHEGLLTHAQWKEEALAYVSLLAKINALSDER
ncbi:MAG: hypothetical protein KatS3mg015_1268 [Fimbriimonadales bacterium]|nr:MAG: hypothetical protein KatS3mg015_1268 [Fimbriimonadales bacterium]